MPEQLQQTAPPVRQTAPPTTAPPQGDAQDTVGNNAVQQQALTWSAALGDFLGPKLHEAVAGQLSDDKLVGHAQGAVGSATEKLQAYLLQNTQASDHEAATLFVQHLDGELRRAAQQLVVDSGLSDGIRGFVDDNPLAVTTAAVAAAAAYILTNQDLPLISSKKGLGGGHSLVGGVDPGRTLDLALEQVRLGYRYESAGTKAELTGDYFGRDGGYQLQGRMEQQLGAGLMTGGLLHSERDGTTRDRLDLGFRNDRLSADAWAERQRGANGDLSTVGGRLSNVAGPDQLQAYLRGEARSDGSYEAAGGLSKRTDDWGWGVEGYSGRDNTGREDSGVRAVFSRRF